MSEKSDILRLGNTFREIPIEKSAPPSLTEPLFELAAAPDPPDEAFEALGSTETGWMPFTFGLGAMVIAGALRCSYSAASWKLTRLIDAGYVVEAS